MKILTTTLISLCLLGSSVALANPKHHDVKQDEFWHGEDTVSINQNISLSDTGSVKPYDVEQDEFWHGAETKSSNQTMSSSDTASVKPYDVEQDEFWHGA